MSARVLTEKFEVSFHLSGAPDDERETAYPTIEVTFEYSPGRPAFTPRGEYAPIDPPDPAEVHFISAKLIDGDGLDLDERQTQEIAENWLNDEGYDAACDRAAGWSA